MPTANFDSGETKSTDNLVKVGRLTAYIEMPDGFKRAGQWTMTSGRRLLMLTPAKAPRCATVSDLRRVALAAASSTCLDRLARCLTITTLDLNQNFYFYYY